MRATVPDLNPLPVDAAKALACVEALDCDVFLPGPDGREPVLYRGNDGRLAHVDFDRLRTSGVRQVFVSISNLRRCEEALEENLHEILNDAAISPTQKAACVESVGTAVVRDLLAAPAADVSLDRARHVLDTVIGGVLADPAISSGLLSMSEHHRTTASHLFAVGTLAVLLGVEAFGPDSDQLRDLGMAGMLHDLGKINIDSAILSKAGPLTPAETELIRQHPIESVRLIDRDPAVNHAVRQMILQHHERVDGTGYPLGLDGAEILTGGKILCIVDSFHAMIGRRSYRKQCTPRDATRMMRHRAGAQFDPELLTLWEALFDRCWTPSGSPVLAQVEPEQISEAYHSDHRPPVLARIVRRHRRLACPGERAVQCVYAGRLGAESAPPEAIVARLADLSRAGLCLSTRHPMFRGEVLHVHVDSGATSTWVRAVVCWCRWNAAERSYRVGLSFVRRIGQDQAMVRADVLAMDDVAPPTLGVQIPGK